MASNRMARTVLSAFTTLTLMISALVLTPRPLWPWGCEGHEAVAMIAEKHLTRNALVMVNKILESEPIDPTLRRFCSSQGLDLMADASTWADDERSARPETGPWHYIDIPRGAPESALAESCPASTSCVTAALTRQIELLRNDATDARTRAEALRFVIHFVGDLHQPLHCTTNNDMGGNCVPVTFFGVAPVMPNAQFESYRPNLHAVWDSQLILRIMGSASVQEWAASLERKFSSDAGAWQKEGVNLEAWAWEGHQLAEMAAYGRLSTAIPTEKPVDVKSCSDDNHVAQRLLKLDEQVSEPYQDAVAPVIEQQIAKAGIRLAMILNQIWP